MPSLRDLQIRFSDAVLATDGMAPAFARGDAATAAERMAIYRRTIRSNYRNALGATYPVLKRLLGMRLFNAAVDAYVEAEPSRSGDLNVYGDAFDDFLARYAPAAEWPWLPDVARLEWAIDQAAIAADAPPFDLAALAALPEKAHAGLRFVLHPSAQLIESHYPILHIWQVNQTDFKGPAEVDLREGGDSLLIVRGECGVDIERLNPGEAVLLGGFAAGETLALAADLATEAEPAFDLPAALRRHVANHVLAAFVAPESAIEERPR